MATLKKRRDKWYSRVLWYVDGKQKEKQISLCTDNKTEARKRNAKVTKFEDDIKNGLDYEFPWQKGGGQVKVKELSIILDSKVSGPCLVKNKIKRRYYNFNHFEYDLDTLKSEYKRDLKLDKKTPVPFNYFPNNDPERKPTDCWSQNSYIFFNNWLKLISEKQGDQQ